MKKPARDEIEELDGLEADPQELRNLALDTGQRPLVEDYRARLLAELKRTTAGFANRLPPPRGGVRNGTTKARCGKKRSNSDF